MSSYSNKNHTFLDKHEIFWYSNPNHQIETALGVHKDLKGNPVRIGNGPAAVSGDEVRMEPLPSACVLVLGGKARMVG